MSDPNRNRPRIQGSNVGSGMVPSSSSGGGVVPASPATGRTRSASEESPRRPQREGGGGGRVQGFEIGMDAFTRAMSGAFREALTETNETLNATRQTMGQLNATVGEQSELTKALGREMIAVRDGIAAQSQTNAAIIAATQETARSTATIAGKPEPTFQQNVTIRGVTIDNAIGPQIDPEVTALPEATAEAMGTRFGVDDQMIMYGGININPLTVDPETGEQKVYKPTVETTKALEYYYNSEWKTKTKKELEQEFDRVGATYIDYPNEENEDVIRRLDFIRKIQMQNRAYAAFMKGEQTVPKGHTPTSMFSSERITGTANDGSPIGKVISFTNGIDQITIKADGNGGYYGVQAGKKYGPRTYKEIERWAYLGGYQARELKELKQVIEVIKNPEKLRAVVFRARKL